MTKKIVTQEDLDLNPELVEKGVNVGDEIEIPDTEETQENEQTNLAGDDTGGTNPPPDKKRP